MGGCSSKPKDESNKDNQRVPTRNSNTQTRNGERYETDFLDEFIPKPIEEYQLDRMPEKQQFIDELPAERREIWPYKRRCILVQNSIMLVQDDNSDKASKLLDILKQDMCERRKGDNFHIDDKANKLLDDMYQILNSRKKEFDWMTTFEKKGNTLIRHLSPPVLKGYFPLHDTGTIMYLSLTGVKMNMKNAKYYRLLVLLKNNSRITTLQLSYTGLSSVRATELFYYLSNMKCLTYVGLRGNRLDNSCVTTLDNLMQEPQLFPSLYWVDMRNNVDIVYYPQSLLNAFRARFPRCTENMTMRDLAEGKGIMYDENCDPNKEYDEDIDC